MAETAKQTTVIAASPEHCFAIATEFERYPDWAKDLKDAVVLERDEQGRENCTACGLCAVACPAEAITMTAAERTKDEKHLYREEKYASVYEINMLRCIFCGLCEEACPKEAIFLTDRLVPTQFERGEFIYGKDKLVESETARIDITKRQFTGKRTHV